MDRMQTVPVEPGDHHPPHQPSSGPHLYTWSPHHLCHRHPFHPWCLTTFSILWPSTVTYIDLYMGLGGHQLPPRPLCVLFLLPLSHISLCLSSSPFHRHHHHHLHLFVNKQNLPSPWMELCWRNLCYG